MRMRTDRVILPKPRYESPVSVEEALLKRRSIREFRSGSMTLHELGQLLWAAQGITAREGFRTAPSAGALYPLEVRLLAGSIDGIAVGLYQYDPRKHGLWGQDQADQRIALAQAALDQPVIAEASAVIALSAVYKRTTARYGERGIRYVHMEAGHAAQNIYLEAVTLRLGTVVIGAFDDRRVKEVLRLETQEEPLYLMPIGRL